MKPGPMILHLTQRVCSPENLGERIRKSDGLRERIQEELEFIESPFALSVLRPWYSGLKTGLTGYEMIFFAKGVRLMEISMAHDAAIDHYLDLGRDLPSSVITSMPGRRLADIVGEMGVMEPYWDPDARILDIVRMNDTPWAVFRPRQEGAA